MKIKNFHLFLEGYGIMGTASTNRLDTYYKDDWKGRDLILLIIEYLKKLDVGEISTYYNSDVGDNIIVDGHHFLLWYPYDYCRYQSPKNYDLITFFIADDQFLKSDYSAENYIKLKNFAYFLRKRLEKYKSKEFYLFSFEDAKDLMNDLEHEIDNNLSGITDVIKNYNI
jgi:hypothetical protein